MPKKFILISLLVLICTSAFAQNAGTVLFDDNWSFFRGGVLGAESPDFDASNWRKVDLPHDWSIEDLPGTSSPFNKAAISQVGGGFTTGGTGWYRKTFTIPAAQKGKRIIIQFDGVYMNATVYINGKNLGTHPYGYTGFWFDITDKVKFGDKNLLAVEVKNEGQNSRWYSGSGIYRHVWLRVADPVHIAQWGTFVTTPEVNSASAKVNIKTKVLNESGHDLKISLINRIVDRANAEVAIVKTKDAIKTGSFYDFNQDAVVHNPALWSCESPKLYPYRGYRNIMYDGNLARQGNYHVRYPQNFIRC